MKKIIYVFAIVVAAVQCARAQESMLPDVSYPYLEKLIATAKENYPKVKMYESKIAFAKLAITKTKLSYFELFTFSYLYSPNNTTTLVNPSLLNGYQVGMLINLGTIAQRPPLIKMAREELKYAQYDKEVNDLYLESKVKERYFVYIQQKAILKYKTQMLLDIESMVNGTRYKFEKGEETLINYSNLLISYSDHLKNKIDAEASLLIAKSSLEELLGKKLEDIK